MFAYSVAGGYRLRDRRAAAPVDAEAGGLAGPPSRSCARLEPVAQGAVAAAQRAQVAVHRLPPVPLRKSMREGLHHAS